ncbi:GvpL/GvpF family gas vesicle protein [Neobacillus sp. DY30]|uniref:GvpL/GvpF family gas vesicle protein n=1 Tax=Neobacillus sp. DY30 TaxID=3047871 RepID=UPI0024C01832|nr:GvpL/GvpF family gas vesicle protein [Neobacillus sp. DY30]WHY03019.1 GvpL/GvpF family gas vesicle protein [Neobacillus sp. DY30]
MTHTTAGTNFIYLYGVILAEELENTDVPAILGIDQKNVTIINFKELAAVITSVDPQKYSQQQIDLQLKDPDWLKEKAFHHHECISAIHNQFTILPMSFCTIFQKGENLITLLNEQYDAILQQLLRFKEKQEWNLKIYCNSQQAFSYVIHHNPNVLSLKENIANMPKGKKFIMKKKLDQLITNELEKEQSLWWERMEQQLQSIFSDSRLRKNWGREITERNEDMIVNCDFLIDKKKTEQFLTKVQELEHTFSASGCTFQVSGPWPPYHFSKEN